MAGEGHDSNPRGAHRARRSLVRGGKAHAAASRSAVNIPPRLPADPESFWSMGGDGDRLFERPAAASTPVLPRFGPPPFQRGGFPLLGFLATVYEHVAQNVARTYSASEERVYPARTDSDVAASSGQV